MKSNVNRAAVNMLGRLLAGDTLHEKRWTTGSVARYWRIAGRPGTDPTFTADESVALAALIAADLLVLTVVPGENKATGPTYAATLTDAGRYAARLLLVPLLG